jgi:hypothetical protein
MIQRSKEIIEYLQKRYDINTSTINFIVNTIDKDFEDLKEAFEQYKRESIKWSVEDFTGMELDGWSITEEQAQEALEAMINDHDASLGIHWGTVESYIMDYGSPCKHGKELWRQNEKS